MQFSAERILADVLRQTHLSQIHRDSTEPVHSTGQQLGAGSSARELTGFRLRGRDFTTKPSAQQHWQSGGEDTARHAAIKLLKTKHFKAIYILFTTGTCAPRSEVT